MVAFSLDPGWRAFGPAVIRVRTAKSAVASDHLLHAHFVGWQTAIVRKGTARISARAPRHLSGLADAKVEQHCHRYAHYDEHYSHGSPPARCRAPIGAQAMRSVHCAADKPCSTPMTGIAGCCARAASGHAAAPPSNVMKSRRFTADASGVSDRKDSTPRLRQETAALRDFNSADAARLRRMSAMPPIATELTRR